MLNSQEHLPASDSSSSLPIDEVNRQSFIFPVSKQQGFVVTIDLSASPPDILSIGSVVSLRSELQDTRRGVVFKLFSDSNLADVILAGTEPVRCIEARLSNWWFVRKSTAQSYL